MDRTVPKTIAAGGVTLLVAGRPDGFALIVAAIVHDIAVALLEYGGS